MSTKAKSNRVTTQATNLALISGLTKHEATLTSFSVGGASMTTASVIAALQGDNAAMASVAAAKAAWQTQVQSTKTEQAKLQPMVAGVKQSLKTMFAGQIDTLADFGLTPRKAPAPRTPEEKVASAAKAKATRVARGTMGAVQKKAVKGNVAGVTVTTVLVPSAAPSAGSAPVTASPGATASPSPTSGASAPATPVAVSAPRTA